MILRSADVDCVNIPSRFKSPPSNSKTRFCLIGSFSFCPDELERQTPPMHFEIMSVNVIRYIEMEISSTFSRLVLFKLNLRAI